MGMSHGSYWAELPDFGFVWYLSLKLWIFRIAVIGDGRAGERCDDDGSILRNLIWGQSAK